MAGQSAVARRISGAGSGFRVGWSGLISIFQEISSSIGGAFNLAGGLVLGYHSMKFRQFLIFPNFLRSYVLLYTRIYHVYK